MDSGPQKKFCTYVESRLVDGVNGQGETVAYVPPSALENYWSQANVDDILDSHERPIQESSTFITKNLRHIFSNLVYTGHPQQISWFCASVRSLSDHHLPFSVQDLPQNCTWSKDFLEHQWMFCPLSFTHDTVFKRTLHSRHILPVAYEACLTGSAGASDAATLWRVHMQSECTLPLSKVGAHACCTTYLHPCTDYVLRLVPSSSRYMKVQGHSASTKLRQKHTVSSFAPIMRGISRNTSRRSHLKVLRSQSLFLNMPREGLCSTFYEARIFLSL